MKSLLSMKALIFITTLTLSSLANASLEDALGSIHEAEKAETLSTQQKWEAERQAKVQEVLKAQKAKQASIIAKRKQKAAQQAEEQKLKQAELKLIEKTLANKESERLSDKYREQAYQDRLRELEFIQLQAEAKARANAAASFVNQELKSGDADIDLKQANVYVKKSDADANRDLSGKVGDALIEKAKSKHSDTYNVNVKSETNL